MDQLIKSIRFIFPILFIFLIITGCNLKRSTDYADTIFINGNVITMESSQHLAEAIAIKIDTIMAVGSNEEIKQHQGENTLVIDLKKSTVVPGLIDAHMHFPELGKRTKQLFFDKTKSAEEVIQIVKQ